MKFYGVSRPLYLETDALGVHFGARLLQVRDELNCGCDEVADNVTLHPIAFASKAYEVLCGTTAIWNVRSWEYNTG